MSLLCDVQRAPRTVSHAPLPVPASVTHATLATISPQHMSARVRYIFLCTLIIDDVSDSVDFVQ